MLMMTDGEDENCVASCIRWHSRGNSSSMREASLSLSPGLRLAHSTTLNCNLIFLLEGNCQKCHEPQRDSDGDEDAEAAADDGGGGDTNQCKSPRFRTPKSCPQDAAEVAVKALEARPRPTGTPSSKPVQTACHYCKGLRQALSAHQLARGNPLWFRFHSKPHRKSTRTQCQSPSVCPGSFSQLFQEAPLRSRFAYAAQPRPQHDVGA